MLLHEGLGSLEMWKDIPEKLFKELGLNILFTPEQDMENHQL